MEKSQQELKRIRLENRKYKDLATFALQYQKHNDGIIVEYYNGFRKTNAKRKVNLFSDCRLCIIYL